MGAAATIAVTRASTSPFALGGSGEAYRRWRAWKLAVRPATADDLVVEVDDPRTLRPHEHAALLDRIARAGVAVYRSRVTEADKELPRALGAQLGLHRLDANWLADDDGISSIEVSERSDGRGGFIPYTSRPIRWHTDGYYHPPERRIQGMILHCVRPARAGGVTGLLDHELAYLALRDAAEDHVRALTQPDAMTIPARTDEGGVARPAQAGPVFSLGPDGDALHMRYTARTRSIEWKPDAATRGAVACLEQLLADEAAGAVHLRLEAGMGLVGHNVLHERSAFDDDPSAPRLLYRARYLDRVALPRQRPWD